MTAAKTVVRTLGKVALALALLAPAAGLSARLARADGSSPSLWSDETGNRYSNRKALRVGDLVTVIVIENSQGTKSATLKTNKEDQTDLGGGPGKGPLSFIPLFSAKSDLKDQINGTGQTSLSGQLSTKISAEVVEIRPDGHLIIEGSRMVSVNGDEDRITLHGVARPEDIQADNTIYSTFLADARITYAGKGPASHAAQKGFLLRLLSWIL